MSTSGFESSPIGVDEIHHLPLLERLIVKIFCQSSGKNDFDQIRSDVSFRTVCFLQLCIKDVYRLFRCYPGHLGCARIQNQKADKTNEYVQSARICRDRTGQD